MKVNDAGERDIYCLLEIVKLVLQESKCTIHIINGERVRNLRDRHAGARMLCEYHFHYCVLHK
jgi:hypothetical protein